jgi:hypothetical protein
MNELQTLTILQQIANQHDLTDSSLSNLINQLRTDWIADRLQVLYRNRIPRGADADKEASPVNGSIYMATDTKKVYACYEDGTWTAIGGGGTLTKTADRTTGDWYSGTATSGLTGDDLVTLGADDTPLKIQSFFFKMKNLADGANVTVRAYMKVDSDEEAVYSSLGNGQNFVKGIDADAPWLLNGEICIPNALRIEIQSDKAADDAKEIGFEYLTEA